MTRSSHFTPETAMRLLGPLLLMTLASSPGHAGMTQDLEDCTAADRKSSAQACTRVMNSGRLPDEQLYIGTYNRAWSYFNAGDTDKALADFNASIRYNKTFSDTYYARAVVEHQRGERDKSLADLDRYLELKGDVAEAHLSRAMMFRRRGETERALTEINRAAELGTQDAKVGQKIKVVRALVLSDHGDATEARAEANAAVAAKDKEPGGYYARALIAYRAHEAAASEADVDTALSLKETSPSAHTLKGRLLEDRGDAEGAKSQYQRALAIPSKSVDAHAAYDEARDRLAALGASEPAKVAVTDTDGEASSATGTEARESASSDCRRFIPAVGATVAVDCPR